MEKKKAILVIGILIIVTLVVYALNPDTNSNGTKITIYKTLTCGCCEEFITELQDNGFNLDIKVEDNIKVIKEKYQISPDMESCHTSIMGNYFLEGHIPVEAINKLLAEQPEIDGIALPGMPTGSLGMPGEKTEPLIIYSITDGQATEYMRI